MRGVFASLVVLAVVGSVGLSVGGPAVALLSPGLQSIVPLLGLEPTQVILVTSGGSERAIPCGTFVQALSSTSFAGSAGSDGPVPAERCAVGDAANFWCGPDLGEGNATPGPFCDTSSAWILHERVYGAGYTEAVPGVGPTPPICGGSFGPTLQQAIMSCMLFIIDTDGLPSQTQFAVLH